MIGMTGFILLVLVLLIGVWQDYREELKKSHNVLNALYKIVILSGESSDGRCYQENKTDKKLFPASWPVYVPSMKELMEKKC
jgi:hypothetical protein